MLCDVVRLRAEGLKLPRDQVRATPPVRGNLQLGPGRAGWHRGQRDAQLLAGLVGPGESRWLLPPLDAARVRAIKLDNILIFGFEEHDLGRGRVQRHQQAWWCRVVGGANHESPMPAQRSSPDRQDFEVSLAGRLQPANQG